MTNPTSKVSRGMRFAKLTYVAVHAAYFVGRWLLGILVGFLMGGAGGEGPVHIEAPETGPIGSSELVSNVLVGAALISIVLPLLRRRFDLISISGSFVIVSLLWVQVDLQSKLVHGDPGFARFAATLYTIGVVVPFSLVGLLGLVSRRRQVRAAKNAARGLCPGCGFDRSSTDILAVCPECGAASVAPKMLED